MLKDVKIPQSAADFSNARGAASAPQETASPVKKPIQRHPSGGSADLGPDPSPSNFLQGPLNGLGW